MYVGRYLPVARVARLVECAGGLLVCAPDSGRRALVHLAAASASTLTVERLSVAPINK